MHVLYARATDKASVADQLIECRLYSQRMGEQVRSEHFDVGSGTTAADERPGLSDALEAIQPGDCLVVRDAARAFRTIEHMADFADKLEARGAHMRAIIGDVMIDSREAAWKLLGKLGYRPQSDTSQGDTHALYPGD